MIKAAALALALAAALTTRSSRAEGLANPETVSATASALAIPFAAGENGLLEIAAAVNLSKGPIDAELGDLGGGPLTLALREAARAGRPLRLLLDPSGKGTQRIGRRIAKLTPTAQVRWLSTGNLESRWMRLADVGCLVWKAGPDPEASLNPGDDGRFEQDWRGAVPSLKQALRLWALSAQLQALPDPREASPHYVRRRLGGAP
jgi:hypothetical protein